MKKKIKYFFASDTHGMRLANFLAVLDDKGFNEKKDKLVLAGDLSDGLGYDNELIAYFSLLDARGCLIAIRGNHDPTHNDGEDGGPREYVQHLNKGAGSHMSDINYKWLADLPTQYENEHFRLAHGIFLTDEWDWESEAQKNNASIWGSPVLVQAVPGKWWWYDSRISQHLIDLYKGDVLEYAKAYGDKDMYLGHFNFETLKKYSGDKLTVVDGWNKIENITWLDQNVLGTRMRGFDIYVKEY